jgi:hypothetical protein
MDAGHGCGSVPAPPRAIQAPALELSKKVRNPLILQPISTTRRARHSVRACRWAVLGSNQDDRLKEVAKQPTANVRSLETIRLNRRGPEQCQGLNLRWAVLGSNQDDRLKEVAKQPTANVRSLGTIRLNRRGPEQCQGLNLRWAVLGSNQRPLPCQGSALPLRQPPVE